MAVRLEFLTQDPDEIRLAVRYWAMDEEGEFFERVSDLVPFRDILQSGQIAKQVREYCFAYDENQCCHICQGVVRVYGRRDIKKNFQLSSAPCESCLENFRRKEAEQQALEQAEIAKRLVYKYERNASATLCYDELRDHVVILLLAMDALLAPKLANGTFSIRDCDDLSPWGGINLAQRLYREGILLDDPDAAIPGTYYMKNDELWSYTYQLQLFLPPDAVMGRGTTALGLLENHVFSDSEALIDLWLDYAVADVLRYLIDQCNTYQHDLEDEAFEKIKGILRHALRTYSVSELWSVIWKSVKDAASLANMQYYNRVKAAATIPTKIRKLLELAEKKGGINHSWNRPDHHLAGSLGIVFLNLFGIDENIQGRAVIGIFNRLCRSSEAPELDELRSLAQSFLRGALEGEDSWQAINLFAEKIRDGLTTEDAIVAILSEQEYEM